MYDACDTPQFFTWKEPVAQKEHKCCECNAKINKGEKYLLCKGKWHGEVDSYKQHFLCAEACMYIRDHLNEECIGFGYLFDWAGENVYKDNKGHKDMVPLRDMLAKIRWRERNEA